MKKMKMGGGKKLKKVMSSVDAPGAKSPGAKKMSDVLSHGRHRHMNRRMERDKRLEKEEM